MVLVRLSSDGMRLVLLLGLLVSGVSGVACAGPHSSGALWTQQYVEQEKAYFALDEAQQRAQIQVFERGLADEALAAEVTRIEATMQDCPGSSQPLAASAGDTRRDAMRIQA